MHHLESYGSHQDPLNVKTAVVDAMFLFHTQIDLPPVYVGNALKLLQQLFRLSPRADLVLDNYNRLSTNDAERERCGLSGDVFSIKGPYQKGTKTENST